jgi:hypothetical protein
MVNALPQALASYREVLGCPTLGNVNRATCPNFAHVHYFQLVGIMSW